MKNFLYAFLFSLLSGLTTLTYCFCQEFYEYWFLFLVFLIRNIVNFRFWIDILHLPLKILSAKIAGENISMKFCIRSYL